MWVDIRWKMERDSDYKFKEINYGPDEKGMVWQN